MSTVLPARSEDISPEWIAAVAGALAREGQAFRAGDYAPVIEVQSINTGAFMPLNLPTNSVFFTDELTRDAVLEMITRKCRA